MEGPTAPLGAVQPVVRPQASNAANVTRQLGRCQREQLRLVDEKLLCRYAELGLEVVAEPVRERLEIGNGLHIGLLLRGAGAARCEGNRHIVPALFGGLLDGGRAAEDNEIGERHFLAAACRTVERLLNAFERSEHLLQLCRLVDLPILLRAEPYAMHVRTAAVVR